ncbi:unnamed protein product [Schistocephalus solidus]|uniref:LITAF domain-containing protein n=1 Tax=Schistocephalus solidus TaxID=70667 RepID=A0A183TAV6_SCHSO|nr:unnamed protein product [Schistocephalus solidus]
MPTGSPLRKPRWLHISPKRRGSTPPMSKPPPPQHTYASNAPSSRANRPGRINLNAMQKKPDNILTTSASVNIPSASRASNPTMMTPHHWCSLCQCPTALNHRHHPATPASITATITTDLTPTTTHTTSDANSVLKCPHCEHTFI